MDEELAGLDTMLEGMTNPPAEPATPPAEPPADTTETTETATPPAETPAPTPGVTTPPDDAGKAQAAAFAKFRTENAQYKKVLDRVIAKNNVQNIDELMGVLDQEELTASAKEMNMSPEAAKRFQDLERQTNEATQALRMQTLTAKLSAVQNQYKIDDEGVKSFVTDLRDNNVDVFGGGLPLEKYYIAFNHDKLVADAIKAEKEKWVAHDKNASNSSNTAPGPGKGDTGSKQKVTTMNELDALLTGLNKK